MIKSRMRWAEYGIGMRERFYSTFSLKTVKGRNQLGFAGVLWRIIEILMLNMLD
jgi:hypothetical protein